MTQRLLLIPTPEDVPYLPRLKSCVADSSVALYPSIPTTLAEVEFFCAKREITGIITTSQKVLQLLLSIKSNPSIDNYAGSVIKRGNIEYLILNPLKQLISVPYGKFVTTRYCSKLTQPAEWLKLPKFNWAVSTTNNFEEFFNNANSSILLSVDIETTQTNTAITCIGFTAVCIDGGLINSYSYVIPMDSEYNLSLARRLCWEIKAPKVLQNGKYDIAYLARYNCILYNYLFDTAAMMHCWFSELPKDLASLNSFFVRESMYWKDLAKTNDRYEYYKYNALDTYVTAMVAVTWLLQAPEWAKENYKQEFPLVFPCHLVEMTGIKRDMDRLVASREKLDIDISAKTSKLEVLTATPKINPNSPKQIKELLTILGCKDITSTDEPNLKKAALRHPINSVILNLILDIRGDRKLVSTYLSEGKEFKGTILYSLTPWATDTGRLASKEHHFWCGLQIQNIPRGNSVKSTLKAYIGFKFAECDLTQAESRDTAHIAGDESMIAAVSGIRDFHSVNASAFFGVAYDLIYCDKLHKVIDKVLRDLAKRVNHGANYNMGWAVLVETMGEENIRKAQSILGLNRFWSLQQVAEYLLGRFHKTYPNIRGLYYPKVITDVAQTRKLVGATGWTRYCFGSPQDNKRDLNALVAHCPQSLNAMKLNKAFMRVFYEIALDPVHSQNFYLIAQIHDSILFQFREGHEYLAAMVAKCMEVEVSVTGADGKKRSYIVPVDIKAGFDGKGSTYWSEVE